MSFCISFHCFSFLAFARLHFFTSTFFCPPAARLLLCCFVLLYIYHRSAPLVEWKRMESYDNIWIYNDKNRCIQIAEIFNKFNISNNSLTPLSSAWIAMVSERAHFKKAKRKKCKYWCEHSQRDEWDSFLSGSRSKNKNYIYNELACLHIFIGKTFFLKKNYQLHPFTK